MPSPHETAYPRLKSSFTPRELAEVYTPTPEELALADRVTKGPVAKVCFLVLLKTFQRLGYAHSVAEVPPTLLRHIAQVAGVEVTLQDLAGYDTSGTRIRHLPVIRKHLQLQPYGPAARQAMTEALYTAAQTKEDLADLINVAIEELVRQRFELPAFSAFLRLAKQGQAQVLHGFYQQVTAHLAASDCARLDALFVADPATGRSRWQRLKVDPGRPTLTHLREHLDYLAWLSDQQVGGTTLLADLPQGKRKHFAAEAKTLDSARMAAMAPAKRYTLAVAFLAAQLARARDDLADLFVRRMEHLQSQAKAALEQYQVMQQVRMDALVTTLREVVSAYQTEGSPEVRLQAIEAVLGPTGETVLQQCDAHLAASSNQHFPFLWPFFKSHRASLFRLVEALTFRATSQERSLEEALRFLQAHEGSRGEWLQVATIRQRGKPNEQRMPLLDLSWIPDIWWPLVSGQRKRTPIPERLHRRHVEVCFFSELMLALKSGDMAVLGSDAYADYREQFISWEEYEQQVEAYGVQVGLPTDGKAFVAHVQHWLETIAQATDRSFPSNTTVRIEQGKPSIAKAPPRPLPVGLKTLEQLIAERMEPINILDVLGDTEHWLHWTRCFGPISGHESKLDQVVERYLTATFCYGCHLGPSQTARALPGVDRRQIAWVNQRHVTEEKLDEAIRLVINGYNRFALPKWWGSGKRAAADGTKWDLYEQNLLAEYHIRYGGYGGIGYYHVSDTYIALFSHFIPCGVWEAVYILDGLLKNRSEIQPDTVHADTQGQSTPVFGLAYLLGINLMPRIRNWQHLIFYRPSRTSHYEHLDDLFTDTINWDLIETHLPDLLRVVLSIKNGRLNASTLLRRLGTYSRRNRLYQAFRELGCVIRTGFLLQYLGDAELRAIIQAATNKSEAFNGFIKWLAFGGEGMIAENDRDDQRKIIKYNHLVANCVIFSNVVTMTRCLHELAEVGHSISQEAVAALSPYLTQHINRFGRYHLDLTRQPPPLTYDVPILITEETEKQTA